MSGANRAYLIVGGMISGMRLRRALVQDGRSRGLEVCLDRTRRHPEVAAYLNNIDRALGIRWIMWGDKWEIIVGGYEDVLKLKEIYDDEWVGRGRSKRIVMVVGGDDVPAEVEEILRALMSLRTQVSDKRDRQLT